MHKKYNRRDFIKKDSILSAASKLFGKEPETINHISYGNEDKIGRLNLEELNINRIDLQLLAQYSTCYLMRWKLIAHIKNKSPGSI